MAQAKEREKKTTSFIIYTDTKKKLNILKAEEGKELTDLVEEALQDLFAKYSKKKKS